MGCDVLNDEISLLLLINVRVIVILMVIRCDKYAKNKLIIRMILLTIILRTSTLCESICLCGISGSKILKTM